MKMLARAVLLLGLLMPIFAERLSAAPVTTKYFSLDLPADWVVISGPTTQKGAVQVLLGQKDHKTSLSVIVGPAEPGDAEKAAEAGSKRLQGSKPVADNGQLYFTFEQKGITGYSVVREDVLSKLLLVLIVSGDTRQADFIYKLRGPYKTLYPRQP